MAPGWVTRRRGRAGVGQPREAEVENLHAAVARPHHVLGLQVAVHDAALVRVRQRGGQVPCERVRSAGDGRRPLSSSLRSVGRP